MSQRRVTALFLKEKCKLASQMGNRKRLRMPVQPALA